MSTLTTTRNYEDGEILMQAELDLPLNQIEALFNVTQLNDDNFENNSIDAGAKILNGTITTTLFDNSAVTSTTIEDEAVTGAKLAADVTGAGLSQDVDGNLQVNVDDTTISIDFDELNVPDDGVVTAKFGDGSVTRSKLAADNTEYSAVGGITLLAPEASDTWFTAATTSTGDTGITTTIETSGRPLLVSLMATGQAPFNAVSISPGVQILGATAIIYIRILRNGTNIGGIKLRGNNSFAGVPGWSLMPFNLCFIDSPSAGNYTYVAEIKVTDRNPAPPSLSTVEIDNMQLVAMEF